jgi:hypothetical protein|tara:strand:+ start:811 stop:1017 length:207 start_codon:yes stop_codon:yes gene_type:complete
MMVKVLPVGEKDGVIHRVDNWLYRLDDIQEAMGAIGLSEHNEKLFDELVGFPNKENKTIGVFMPQEKA